MIKLTWSWSAFYYHHVPAIPNNVNEKFLFLKKCPLFLYIPSNCCGYRWVLTVSATFQLEHFNNLSFSEHLSRCESWFEALPFYTVAPTHRDSATIYVPSKNKFKIVWNFWAHSGAVLVFIPVIPHTPEFKQKVRNEQVIIRQNLGRFHSVILSGPLEFVVFV